MKGIEPIQRDLAVNSDDFKAISVSLGRVEEKLENIGTRLDKQETQIEKLARLITGNGTGEGLMPQTMRMAIELESFRERCRSMEEKIYKVEASQSEHEKILEHSTKMFHENPPLLWLARYKTRQTAMVIVIIFILLSLWWVSGWRQPILDLLGLPIF